MIEKHKVKLVIVDSAVAHYRAEFLGRGTLAERQQRLNRFMHTSSGPRRSTTSPSS